MLDSNDFLALTGILGTLLISFYAAYWAFDIRKALAVKLYRNQALGIGLLALTFSAVFFVNSERTPISTVLSHYFVVPFYFSFLFLLYWIDTSVRAARRSDPLVQDILKWTKIRLAVWILNFVFIAIYLSIVTYDYVFSPIPHSLVPVVLTVGVLPLFIATITGMVLLPISARRSSDSTLRKHLNWFGRFTICALIATFISGETYPYHHIGIGLITYAAMLVGAYCLYRSAKALVPLNRLPVIEPGMIPSANGGKP